jgi:cytochrome c-type biogenesis protein
VPFDLGLLAFAFSLGVATFFSPCSVALVPAYVAYYTGSGADRPPEGERSGLAAAIDGVRFGAAAAVGVLGLFAVGSLAIYLLRSRLGVVDSADLLATFEGAGVVVGLGLVALGGLVLASRAPRLTLPVRAPEGRSPASMAAFGVVFALASMGCTLPLFFGLIGTAIGQPPLAAVAMVAAFGAAIAGLLLAVSVGLSVAEDAVRDRLRSATRYAKPVSGLLLVAAGLYTVNFYLGIVPV